MPSTSGPPALQMWFTFVSVCVSTGEPLRSLVAKYSALKPGSVSDSSV